MTTVEDLTNPSTDKKALSTFALHASLRTTDSGEAEWAPCRIRSKQVTLPFSSGTVCGRAVLYDHPTTGCVSVPLMKHLILNDEIEGAGNGFREGRIINGPIDGPAFRFPKVYFDLFYPNTRSMC